MSRKGQHEALRIPENRYSKIYINRIIVQNAKLLLYSSAHNILFQFICFLIVTKSLQFLKVLSPINETHCKYQ